MKIGTREELNAVKRVAIEAAGASLHAGYGDPVVSLFLELARQANIARETGCNLTVTIQPGGEHEN